MTIANFNPVGRHAKTLPSVLTLKRKVVHPLTILMLSTLSLNTANVALTATTAQTIKGSEPYFKLGVTPLISLDELMGFTYPDAGVNISVTAAQAGSTIIVPVNTPFNQLIAAVPITNTVTTLASLVQTGSNPLTVADAEGDTNVANTNTANGSITATLTRNNSSIINAATSTDTFSACDSYQLTITVTPVSILGVNTVNASTQYGDPNSSNNYYSGISTATKAVTYNILPDNAQICFIKPRDLTVISNQYNATYFEVSKGFKADILKANSQPFPVTGFPYAELQVIGSGGTSVQGQYECKIPGGASWVTLSTAAGAGTNCTVTYNATSGTKPTTPVTIELGTIVSGSYVPLDTYTIPAPTLWAEAGNPTKIGAPYTSTYHSSVIPYNTDSIGLTGRFLAGESCYNGPGVFPGWSAGVQNVQALGTLFRIGEITNAIAWNRSFTRQADGSFMGEWGKLVNYGTVSTNIWGNGQIWAGWTSFVPNAWWLSTVNLNSGGWVDQTVHRSTYSVVCRR